MSRLEAVRLTTEEHPGRSVHTRVRCGFAEGRLYLRASPSDEWPRHIWDQPLVRVARCGPSGRSVAAPTLARGRILPAGESDLARRALAGGGPLRRLARRLRSRPGDDELYVELVPTTGT
jgi:hypothetical protein